MSLKERLGLIIESTCRTVRNAIDTSVLPNRWFDMPNGHSCLHWDQTGFHQRYLN